MIYSRVTLSDNDDEPKAIQSRQSQDGADG